MPQRLKSLLIAAAQVLSGYTERCTLSIDRCFLLCSHMRSYLTAHRSDIKKVFYFASLCSFETKKNLAPRWDSWTMNKMQQQTWHLEKKKLSVTNNRNSIPDWITGAAAQPAHINLSDMSKVTWCCGRYFNLFPRLSCANDWQVWKRVKNPSLVEAKSIFLNFVLKKKTFTTTLLMVSLKHHSLNITNTMS